MSAGVYQYFLKVVPTSYTTKEKRTTLSNQYSVTEHYISIDPELIPRAGIPALTIFYDLSAVKVRSYFSGKGTLQGRPHKVPADHISLL
jgi:endoplasmic reticulum-Golgi intermediate compartment protein 3